MKAANEFATNLITHQYHKQSDLTFLKSNYKYKRRNQIIRWRRATTTTKTTSTSIPTTKKVTVIAEESTSASLPANMEMEIDKRINQNTEEEEEHKGKHIISSIESLLIIILMKFMQLNFIKCYECKMRLRTDAINIDINQCCAVNNNDNKVPMHWHQKETTSPQENNNFYTTTKAAAATTTTANEATTATTRTQLAPITKRKTSATTVTTATTLTMSLSLRLTLFIALTTFTLRHVEAGACWQTALNNGKCNEIFSLNITKTECCRANPEFSYTDRELSNVEYFFATAIGGGVECAPCIESCKSVKCGPNKKCVKRKGRPKCICAPECGAAVRRKHQQQQHHNEPNERQMFPTIMKEDQEEQDKNLQRRKMIDMDIEFEKSPRDIRSLSSEITNINLDLNGAKRQYISNSNSNNNHRHQHNQQQQYHHQHQHHHHHDPENNDNNNNNNQRKQQHQRHILRSSSQSQEKPQTSSTSSLSSSSSSSLAESQQKHDSFKPRKLLIATNVQQYTEQQHHQQQQQQQQQKQSEKPTTRRVQILSNIEMPPYPNERRLSNSNSKSNINSNNNYKNDDLTRSSMTVTTETTLNIRRHNAQSRHKTITNEPNEYQQKRQRNHNSNTNSNINTNSNSNSNNNFNINKVRHIHQNIRPIETDEGGATERDTKEQQYEGNRDMQQRKRKHHHHHQQQQQQHHNHHRNNNNRNNNNNKHKRRKHKDHMANNTQETPTATTFTVAAARQQQSQQQQQQQQEQQKSLTATTAFKMSTLDVATPVNSTMSGERHFLSNTSNEHGSKIPTSSSSSSSSSVTLSSIGSSRSNIVGNKQSADFGYSDDLTLLDGIHEQFSQHGFPSQQQQESLHHSHPVCGSDGRTYNTECQLKKRACRTDNPNLHVAYRGHCQTNCNGVKCLNGLTCVEDQYMIPHCIACKIDCPHDDGDHDLDADGQSDDNDQTDQTVIDPKRAVCGVDGKTYKSTCDINRMICKIGRAIAVAYPGPCQADRVTCADINCGPKNTCLIDLLTHEPRCVSCRYKCARKRHPMRYETGKICGVNKRTYNSWCEMRKDSCSTGFFIDVLTAGACH